MPWVAPRFTRSQVDKAGDSLLLKKPDDAALKVIDNWRSAHRYPLTMFEKDLRKKAEEIEPGSIVALRIKRLSSIADKLKSKRTRLSTIQDIAGCRAVLSDVARVSELVATYMAGYRHKLSKEFDYIESPKRTGYRGVHLIYEYSGEKAVYRGLKVEIQIRSSRQHAWATAVETVGHFTSQALKSNKGSADWLRFFALMGSAIARMERQARVPNTPTDDFELQETLQDYVGSLNVVEELNTYRLALKEIFDSMSPHDRYFLLRFDPRTKVIQIYPYPGMHRERAAKDYLSMEKATRDNRTGENVVLVSASSTEELRQAYPNYFLDTTAFLDIVEEAVR